MPPAIANFDEPHAWLLRGLVEYGWIDGTRGIHPGQSQGSIDLTPLLQSQGRAGVVLHVPAEAHGPRGPDQQYTFEAKLTQTEQGTVWFVRSEDCNFLAEYPVDPHNPLYAAGYLDQGIRAYLPQFIQWRLQGGTLSVAQQRGLPNVEGFPCSGPLAAYLQQLSADPAFRLDQGPQLGWWAQTDAEGGALTGGNAIAWAGAVAELPSHTKEALEQRAKFPAGMLTSFTAAGAAWALFWMGNSIATLVHYKTEELFAVAASLVFSIVLLTGSVVSAYGIKAYRRLQPSPLVYASIGYVALMPFCCFTGLPAAGFALWLWRQPEVRRARGEAA